MSLNANSTDHTETLSQRILIIGSTNAGKTTLARRLSNEYSLPFVELDALNWQPGWRGLHEHDPVAFENKINDAIFTDTWLVAGNYTSYSQRLIWPKVETIIWLDLPLSKLTFRLLRRSWKRWRKKELLWGTNTEEFWPHLAIWRKDSLLRWLWKTHRLNQEQTLAAMKDPRWAHINFIHLRSQEQVNSL